MCNDWLIRRARELGFSIEDIRALLALADPSRASCAEVREIARTHLVEVRAKLADLAKLEHNLAETVARCSGEAAPSCPVLDMLGAQQQAPHEEKVIPESRSGARRRLHL